MRAYQTDDVTLDPGRTALALGGLRGRNVQYPFLVQQLRHRRSRRARMRRIRAALPNVAWSLLKAVFV